MVISFQVDPDLAYISGNSVLVIDKLIRTHSFEGTVTFYDRATGNISIGNIQNIIQSSIDEAL
jgi:hypothetical protein